MFSAIKLWRQLTKVCSFSAVNDSLLMWGHYAHKAKPLGRGARSRSPFAHAGVEIGEDVVESFFPSDTGLAERGRRYRLFKRLK